jgi:hypothetical protein
LEEILKNGLGKVEDSSDKIKEIVKKGAQPKSSKPKADLS